MKHHDVFISYSTKNSQVALAVCHVLEQNNIKCWIAPRDIQVGAEYADLIDSAIEDCRLCLLIFSDGAMKSKWVQSEIGTAFEAGKSIVPFKIENIPLQGTMRIILNDKHWMDAYPNPEKEFANLVQVVRHILSAWEEQNGDSIPQVHTPVGRKPSIFRMFGSNRTKINLVCNRDAKIYVDGKKQGEALDELVFVVKVPAEPCVIEAVSKDYKKARVLVNLDGITASSKITRIDMAKAEFNYLQDSVKGGDSENVNQLGIELLDAGKYSEALKFFYKAANMDCSAAYYNLGIMYDFGKGVEIDKEAAAEFYTKSIQSGDYSLAYNNLGSHYYNGNNHIKQDYKKAFELFYKAAIQSVEAAQLTVGLMLFDGKGVEKNRAESKKWLEKAAAQGSDRAQMYLDSWID